MTAPTDIPHWSAELVALGADPEFVAWARTQLDFDTAWQQCARGDWMLWYAGRFAGGPGSDARRPLVRAACACARLGLPAWEKRYPDDRRPHIALDTAEAWARGDTSVTLADVRVAGAAADYTAASWAAFTGVVHTANAAAYAAHAVVYTAFAAFVHAVAMDATASATYDRVLAECADIVRHFYPLHPAPEGSEELPKQQRKLWPKGWPSLRTLWRRIKLGATL